MPPLSVFAAARTGKVHHHGKRDQQENHQAEFGQVDEQSIHKILFRVRPFAAAIHQ